MASRRHCRPGLRRVVVVLDLNLFWDINGSHFHASLAHHHSGVVGNGGLAAYAALELDYTSGVLHYGLYLGITVLLRLCLQLYPLVVSRKNPRVVTTRRSFFPNPEP